MLLYRHERKAISEGRLPPDAARFILRRRFALLLGGLVFGYAIVWVATRLIA